MNIALLFEQSGSFKNILQKHGHNAKDFDLNNEFNTTDYQMDLFDYIINTDMKRINKSDLIIAFFPCTYFSNNNELFLNGVHYSMKKWSEQHKSEYISRRLEERQKFENVLITLIQKIKVPMIIENPNSKFIINFCKRNNLKYIMHSRDKHGDFYRKPTVYILLNDVNITELDIDHSDIHLTIQRDRSSDFKGISRKLRRSLISDLYINNLLRHVYVKNTKLI